MEPPLTQRPQFTNLGENYRGRFAPSPSGLLHFGSLIAALASFLDAKHHQGKWLVRIEDIDPPREQKGASSAILKTLESYGLHWDEQVLYQSNQSKLYQEVLAYLQQQRLSYCCQCTRAQIKALGGVYQGHCRTLKNTQQNSATRLLNQHGLFHFKDIFQGNVNCDKSLASEDFIIHRKDGLFAYQLAVVVDDIEQNINTVIRGCDLLEPTARQLTLFKTLNKQAPQYGHVPLAITPKGFKLSKQNKAPAIDNNNPIQSLIAALAFLGQEPATDLAGASVEEIINWATINWQRSKVPKQTEICIS